MKRPFLTFVIALSVGIFIASLVCPIPFWIYAAACAASLIITFKYRSSQNISKAALTIAIAALGAALFTNANSIATDHIAHLISDKNNHIIVEGVVIDDPFITSSSYSDRVISFLLKAKSYTNGAITQRVQGLVKVKIYDTLKPIQYGQRVRVEGTLLSPQTVRNPGIFGYGEYLLIKDIHCVLRGKGDRAVEIVAETRNPIGSCLFRIRRKINTLINNYFPHPVNSLIAAITTGDRSTLPRSLNDDFIKTGTVHILSISGQHVAIIAAIILGLLSILGIRRPIALITSLILITCYAFLAGANPPIVRSVIMFATIVAAFLIRREGDTINSLAFAATLILIAQPKELFDPSFQLSFGSVASIVIITPKLCRLFGSELSQEDSALSRMRKYIVTGLAGSMAASIGTWPIVAHYFNIISPISVIANLVIIPILTAIMTLTAIFFAAAAIPQCAAVVALIISFFVKALFSINNFFGNLPLASFHIPSGSTIFLVGYYGLAAAAFMPDKIFIYGRSLKRSSLLIASLAVLDIILWKNIIAADLVRPNVTFLDVGAGDAALVRLAGNRTILIDGGSGEGEHRIDMGRTVVAPYLWNNGIFSIDAVIVTHSHDDHIGGVLYVLDKFRVGTVIDNDIWPDDGSLQAKYDHLIATKNIAHIIAHDGMLLTLDGAEFFVLNPEEGDRAGEAGANPTSIVVKFVCKNKNILFTADITSVTMTKMIEKYGDFLRANIMKVPHHGGGLGNMKIVGDFCKDVSPTESVISSAKRKPSKQGKVTIKKILEAQGSKVYETCEKGAIKIEL